MIRSLNKFFLVFIFVVSLTGIHAQVKSTDIQTIDGSKFYIHKVEKSQSLYSISKLYNVSLDEIYLHNPEADKGIKAGQEIRIPVQPAVSATPSVTTPVIDTSKYLTHKTVKGETLYSIGKKYNLNASQLLSYNPELSQGLKDGQTIIIGEKTKKTGVPVDIKPLISKETSTLPIIPDTTFARIISKPKKNAYKIGLILPFRFDQTLPLDVNELAKTNTNFPPIPALALDFYLGFKRAVDSLQSSDFNVTLEIYDGDDKDDSLRFTKITTDPKFKDLDMVFGPFYTQGFKTVSKTAAEQAVPIISPIISQNKILYNNIYTSKTNPSQFTLLECLADFCIDSLVTGNANIILMAPTEKDRRELQYVNAFKTYYNEKQKQLGKTPKDTVTTVRGIAGVKAAFRNDAKNIIVTLSTNQVVIADFSTQLALFAAKKDVTLCGWQATSEMENIDQEYLNQLHYTFPHPYNLTNTAAYLPVIKNYLELMETTPDEYYYIGFDVGHYYLKNLKEFGPDFVYKLDQSPFESGYMRFKFTRPDNLTGFDNRGVYIFKYQDYKLSKTGWK